MEVVDTGAVVSVISTMTRANLFHTGPLSSTSTILTTYTGDPMPVVGEMKVEVSYGEQNAKLSLYVVVGQGPSLSGILSTCYACAKYSGIIFRIIGQLLLNKNNR